MATSRSRTEIAEIRFRQAELAALSESISLAVETRRAWIEAVGAFEAAALVSEAQGTADAGSELASQLGRTGAMNRADQAREHAFTAELAGERAEATLEAQLAKERLIRLMGLWGSDVTIYVPNALPSLPGYPRAAADIERLAGWGPYGPLEMGGMFSVVKVRDAIAPDDYSDPGWYENPPGTQAWEWTGELPEHATNTSPATILTPRGGTRQG